MAVLVFRGRSEFDADGIDFVRFDFDVSDATEMESQYGGPFVPVEARALFEAPDRLRFVAISGPLVDQSGRSPHVDSVWGDLMYGSDDYLGLKWLPAWANPLATIEGAAQAAGMEG